MELKGVFSRQSAEELKPVSQQRPHIHEYRPWLFSLLTKQSGVITPVNEKAVREPFVLKQNFLIMKKFLVLLFLIGPYLLLHAACDSAVSGRKANELRVLQFNIWHEGTVVAGGFEAIADEIVHTNADVVFFSEVRNYNGQPFIRRILEALQQRGKTYYGESSNLDVGTISKYKVETQEEIYPEGEGCGSILRSTFRVNGCSVVTYSAHLDYKNYACYLPRGYDGATWKRMEEPVISPEDILAANRVAYREEAIQLFLQRAHKDIEEGAIVLLGGDFNEPSHLDWQEDTAHLWDHNGAVVAWDCSVLLQQSGFKDVYRDIYPNPVTHPGFTFPSDNANVPVDKLSWAPVADERDRIDFIYYYPHQAIAPVSVSIVGPSTSIVRNRRVEEETEDLFILPKGTWPSDHKAVLALFRFQ